jgi:hypothetical protein
MGQNAYMTKGKQIRARYFESGRAEFQDAIKDRRILLIYILK